MESKMFTRPGLGENAKLGDLYDCRRDSFIGKQIFVTEELPDVLRTVTYKQLLNKSVLQGDKISDKLKYMGINEFMGLNVLAGLIPREGVGKYLQTQKRYARDESITGKYEAIYKREKINIYDPTLSNIIDIDGLKDSGATHFLAGISWGATLLITTTYENGNNEEKQDILSAFQKSFDRFYLGTEKLNQSRRRRSKTVRNTSLCLVSDAVPESPVSVRHHEVQTYIHRFFTSPAIVADGKQVTYCLVPLIFLKDQHGLGIETNTSSQLSSQLALSILELFDEIEAGKLLMNEFDDDNADSEHTLARETICKIQDLESKFRQDFEILVGQINLGRKCITELKKVVEDYKHMYFSPLMVICDFPKTGMRENIEVYRTLRQHNVIYISLQQPRTAPDFAFKFSEFIYKDNKNTYVFIAGREIVARKIDYYFSNIICKYKIAKEYNRRRNKNQMFLSLIKGDHDKSRFIYVNPGITFVGGEISQIRQYKDYKLLVKDVYRNHRRIFSASPRPNKVLAIFTF